MELYVCTIDGLMDLPGEHLIGAERRARMTRYLRVEDRARCLAAGLLVRAALGDCEDAMKKSACGKPYLPGGKCFNLSHSGDYVILGVSDHVLGVDVEKIAPFDERVARRCFTDGELAWLHACDSEGRFYRLWTAKESVMKATGMGFSMPPESFSVLPMEDGWHEIGGSCWYLAWVQLPGHTVCTACAQAETIHMTYLERTQLIVE